MLKELLQAALRGATKEMSVGFIKGELLEEYQKHLYEAQLRHLQDEANKMSFALEIFKTKNPNGKLIIDAEQMGGIATMEFVKSHPDYISERDALKARDRAEHNRLWGRIYGELNIDASGDYKINSATGEVFEKVKIGGDEDGEDNPIH